MASLTIYDSHGKDVGRYDIEPTDLAPRINRRLLHDVVVMYQANRRQGSAKTKSRREVAGSTRKLYRQKGTGNARAGSRRSGIRRGGGHIFALRPRDYSYSMPRKAVRLATRMALASKLRDNEMVLVDDLSFDVPKTSVMVRVLKALGWDGRSLLVTTAQHDPNVYKAARNIRHVTVAAATDLNALTVLSSRRLLLTRAALDVLRQRAAGTAPA
ncbi:MAG: 50S ribosomal protein L4 [Planctomycetes bacterium RBG_16_64_10]|nr:MAG: 50S ribosomal protein L4 [Planctomycetes bacterium RBG_16_64_10]